MGIIPHHFTIGKTMQDLMPFIQHHAALFSLFVAIIIIAIVIELIHLRHSANKVTPTRAVALMNHERAVVIDLRTTEAFKTGHIVDAISIPHSTLKNKIKTLKTYRKRPLLLISESEKHLTQASTELTTAGFHIHVLKGGIHAWRQADLPLVKG